MLSMAVQHNISSIVQPSAYPSPKFALKPLKTPNFANPKPFFSSSLSSFPPSRKRNRCFSLSRISAEAFYDDSDDIPDAIDEDFYDDSDDIPDAIDDEYATDEEVDEEAMQILTPVLEDKRGEEPIQKPLLVLKFIWREKNIGLALDQLLPDYGTVPLSPYYFWPRKDAWEELKALLESKPWISQRQMIILLNQVSDIINLWQQSGGNFVS